MALTEVEARLLDSFVWFRNVHHEVQHGQMYEPTPDEQHLAACRYAGLVRNLQQPEDCCCAPRPKMRADLCEARSCKFANETITWLRAMQAQP